MKIFKNYSNKNKLGNPYFINFISNINFSISVSNYPRNLLLYTSKQSSLKVKLYWPKIYSGTLIVMKKMELNNLISLDWKLKKNSENEKTHLVSPEEALGS